MTEPAAEPAPVRRRRVPVIIALVLVLGGIAYALTRATSGTVTLTGIVTTDEVVVAPQIAGQVGELLVREGDSVAQGALLAVIAPAELAADSAYYTHSAQGYASEVKGSAAALRLEQQQTAEQIRQAEATLAAAQAERQEAAASLEDAKLTYDRLQPLAAGGAAAALDLDHARTALDAATSRVAALDRQVEAQVAALALARANAEQVLVRQSTLTTSQQQRAAADAQRTKAMVRLGYSDIRAPIAGVVDVRAVRLGEFVNPGQPVVTLINPDDLWVRADVEESYIDKVRLGDRLTVRLPSGDSRSGVVFYRGVDAGFATQRDVSRTKRDIKTFEIRLRVDNRDRRLAVGMTAYVLLPVSGR
ncbi:MAG TPA: efflux RND transporter periplasmic adaptor subunit [Gemmatimonadales bacterium]|nr:efflux RND transporter periplasmic adaptor subunit [Gemmatimonadales bacterium]